MARADAGGEGRRAGREPQRRLGDIVGGVGGELFREGHDLGLAGVRPHQHAVAARAVDLLHHQFGDVLLHIFQRIRLAAAECRHVLQQHRLAEVELDDLGHIGVDRLVVGDAGAHCIGQCDGAGLVGAHQSRHAQCRIGPEGERIEIVVVDAAVDHIDPLQPLRGAHEDLVVLHHQIGALHQFDAELVGKERMLVIGRIVLARRQQHHHWLRPRRGWRDRAQRSQQRVGIVLDRRDAMLGEQVGCQPHHHLAVLQHVGDARRRARIVLQHIELVGVDPDDVDARDMDIDVVRHPPPRHLRPEAGIAEHEVARDQPRLENFARAIDVGEEKVERLHALDQPRFEPRPLGARNDAGDDVERDQPLGGVLVAVDGEGDADAAKQKFRLLAAGRQQLRRRLLQPAGDAAVDLAVRSVAQRHLVETGGGRLGLCLLQLSPLLCAPVASCVALGRGSSKERTRDGAVSGSNGGPDKVLRFSPATRKSRAPCGGAAFAQIDRPV